MMSTCFAGILLNKKNLVLICLNINYCMFAQILKYACISGGPLMDIIWRADRLILQSDWTENGFVVVVEVQCTELALGPGRGQVEDNLANCTSDNWYVKDMQEGNHAGKLLKLAFRQGLLKYQGKFWTWALVLLVQYVRLSRACDGSALPVRCGKWLHHPCACSTVTCNTLSCHSFVSEKCH